MASVRVEVTAEQIAAAPMDGSEVNRQALWAAPVEDALARLTGEEVAIDFDIPRGYIATIGRGAWVLVVELPEAVTDFLQYRWEDGRVSEPIAFDIEVPSWIADLIRIAEARG